MPPNNGLSATLRGGGGAKCCGCVLAAAAGERGKCTTTTLKHLSALCGFFCRTPKKTLLAASACFSGLCTRQAVFLQRAFFPPCPPRAIAHFSSNDGACARNQSSSLSSSVCTTTNFLGCFSLSHTHPTTHPTHCGGLALAEGATHALQERGRGRKIRAILTRPHAFAFAHEHIEERTHTPY